MGPNDSFTQANGFNNSTCQKILDNTPESWRDNISGIEHWIDLIENTNLIDPEEKDTQVVYSNSDSVENVILGFHYNWIKTPLMLMLLN